MVTRCTEMGDDAEILEEMLRTLGIVLEMKKPWLLALF